METFRERFGPWALITGGSEGLGAAFAQALARSGLDLVLVARRSGPLEEQARAIEAEHGRQVRTVSLDLTDPGAARELLRRTADLELGLLICNAASSPLGDFLELPIEMHQRVLGLNCQLAALLALHLGRPMADRGRGGIILVTSMAGLQGTAEVAHYAATKAYLRVLAEGLAEELRPRGVSVLACCAGQVRTPTLMNASPRPPGWLGLPIMEPEQVVAPTLRALGRRAVIVPGLRNSLAAFFVRHVLPRRTAAALASAATRRMFGNRAVR